MARLLELVEVPAGTRLTVQGRPDSCFWLISEGEALVSADARPLRFIGPGETAGVPGRTSPETTIALSSIRALAASPDEFAKLVSDGRIRSRLKALAGGRLTSRRPAQPR